MIEIKFQKIKYLILALPFLLVILLAGPVYAIDSPESVTMPDVKVFRNLIENGDRLYVFQYDIAYASDNYSMEVPASDAFVFRLYDTDNLTLITSSIPYCYPYFDNYGYGNGVGSFYISANISQPMWGDAVLINIYGWPGYFEDTQTYSFTVETDAYTESVGQTENREELYDYVLLLSDRLMALYPDSGIVLKTTSDNGIVLSSYGESYFRGAINGLQYMCPGLFFIQIFIPEQMETGSYTMQLGQLYSSRLDDTDVEEGFERIGDAIGVGGTLAATIIFLAVMIGICCWTAKKGWGLEAGIGISALIGIFAAVILGDTLFTLLMIASLIAAIGIVWVMVIKKA